MQLGVLVDRPLDAHEQPVRFEPRQMLLKIERRPGDVFLLLILRGLIEHGADSLLRHFLFFMYSAMIGLATRKQSTPTGAPQ